ncbi:MAG: DUF429 domain-containing protein [candidate division KSB1 bacterium]|nr:DUF429 domain-containing protein [candidate division KSB1 bacterium]MDZ7304888.1 DUF429 domain-containing protein [candidate division KSB1 bacterium]
MSKRILGIDAAWTERNPSGVALVRLQKRGRPRLLRVARSYEEFCTLARDEQIDWMSEVHGGAPDIPALLAACKKIAGEMPNVIALDIPLAPRPITGRRVADNLVTRLYGGRRAGTHTPTAKRPGPISRMLFEQLTAYGFTWQSAETQILPNKSKAQNSHVFFETYPHPAIIELLGLEERLKYKVSKLQKYWPELDHEARRVAVARELDRLRTALAKRITNVRKWLPPARFFLNVRRTAWLKNYENAIDAIICAWIGCQFVYGRCSSYGDAASAIWLPRPNHRSIKQ